MPQSTTTAVQAQDFVSGGTGFSILGSRRGSPFVVGLSNYTRTSLSRTQDEWGN